MFLSKARIPGSQHVVYTHWQWISVYSPLDVFLSAVFLASYTFTDFLACRIGLLWYHTIIRPFFALDGEEEDAGAEAAVKLLDATQALYPNSALFLYFRYICVYVCVSEYMVHNGPIPWGFTGQFQWVPIETLSICYDAALCE